MTLVLSAPAGCRRDAADARWLDQGPGPVPGEPRSAKTRALEKGAAALQSQPPLRAMEVYLDGLHFASGALDRQVEAHHHCASLNQEVRQCVLFDSNERGARLMGVEYIISERLFRALPGDERRLWHSHAYEIRSGLLVAPGVPEAAERALMADLVATYGKTWHTWPHGSPASGGDAHDRGLPLGAPELMMGFTADGQVQAALVEGRDRRLGVSTAARRRARAELPRPDKVVGADAWERGAAPRLMLSP